MKEKRHLISLTDLKDNDLYNLVSRGLRFSTGEDTHRKILVDHVVGIYFRKTSTRTRTAFSTAALRMGANIISYGPNDLQENTGETIDDTTRVLSSMLDGLVARTAGSPEEMRSFAAQQRMSVINAMSSDEHPTQALTDLTTMMKHFGEISGLRVLYIGEGNNSAAALALALTRYRNTELYLYTPNGYGLSKHTLEMAQNYAKMSGSKIITSSNLNTLPSDIDVVYTTRWETTGTSKLDPNWRLDFNPFAVTTEFMGNFSNAIFMHDLPAHRGDEVTTEVIDGSSSIVFEQAENKLYSAMAVLEWCLNPSY
ncbi:ornithine carbamoyltransferase [Fictibacillus nanhaiensis]|uniref:ornithine carbamoyltransferase n=1 Tax=Fictibacillus nanhaiensis TaxID=742169 RepID=UPI003C166A3A